MWKTTLLTLIGALRKVQDGELKVFGKQLLEQAEKLDRILEKYWNDFSGA